MNETSVMQPPAFLKHGLRRLASQGGRIEREFVEEHWDAAYRAAYLVLGDRQAAEDVAQETMITAVQRLGDLDLSRSPVPWVRRVAVNNCYDRLRLAASHREAPSAEPLNEPGAEGDLEEAVADLALRLDVASALRLVDPEKRVVIVMRYLLDMATKDVADALGVSEGTVKSRASRGLVALKGALEAQAEREEQHEKPSR